MSQVAAPLRCNELSLYASSLPGFLGVLGFLGLWACGRHFDSMLNVHIDASFGRVCAEPDDGACAQNKIPHRDPEATFNRCIPEKSSFLRKRRICF